MTPRQAFADVTLGTDDGDHGEGINIFQCPITLEIPFEPMTASDGIIYDKHAIETYMETSAYSPVTRELLNPRLFPSKSTVASIETAIEAKVIGEREAQRWKNGRYIIGLRRQALEGNLDAMAQLFFCYAMGHKTRANPDLAMTCFRALVFQSISERFEDWYLVPLFGNEIPRLKEQAEQLGFSFPLPETEIDNPRDKERLDLASKLMVYARKCDPTRETRFYRDVVHFAQEIGAGNLPTTKGGVYMALYFAYDKIGDNHNKAYFVAKAIQEGNEDARDFLIDE